MTLNMALSIIHAPTTWHKQRVMCNENNSTNESDSKVERVVFLPNVVLSLG